MSHELETGYFALKTPWHGLGYISDIPLNATEAYAASGLDWDVHLWPMVTYNEANPAELLAAQGAYATVRTRNVNGQTVRDVLGVVGSQYRVIQNSRLFEFAAELMDVAQGDLIIETAGSLKEGRQAWVLARFTEDIVVGGDPIAQFILVASSHDGSMAFTVKPTPIRVVCNNTMQLALAGGMPTYTVKHSEGAEDRIVEARKALDVSWQYGDNFEIEVEKLMNQQAELTPIMDRVMPPIKIGETSDRRFEYRQQSRTLVLRRYEEGDARQFRGTGWGVLNAFNGWSMHDRRGASDTQQAAKGMAGSDQLTQQVHSLLVAAR